MLVPNSKHQKNVSPTNSAIQTKEGRPFPIKPLNRCWFLMGIGRNCRGMYENCRGNNLIRGSYPPQRNIKREREEMH